MSDAVFVRNAYREQTERRRGTLAGGEGSVMDEKMREGEEGEEREEREQGEDLNEEEEGEKDEGFSRSRGRSSSSSNGRPHTAPSARGKSAAADRDGEEEGNAEDVGEGHGSWGSTIDMPGAQKGIFHRLMHLYEKDEELARHTAEAFWLGTNSRAHRKAYFPSNESTRKEREQARFCAQAESVDRVGLSDMKILLAEREAPNLFF